MQDYDCKEEYMEFPVTDYTTNTRANIKIQDGCSNYCAYCIIPYVRGPVRSRTIENVIKEIDKLEQQGFMEIVLNGIHLASFGTDKGESLTELIREIQKNNYSCRFRLGSLDPDIITEKLVQQMALTKHFCPHFHLSLQSGSDTVLKRMNRKYTTKDYRKKTEIIRKIFPDAGITTDIITGFPGETEEEFRQTCEFVREIRFARVHVFPYSSREGTEASGMPNQITNAQKKNRSRKLIQLCGETAQEFAETFIGKELRVLSEKNNKGYSENYLPVKIKNENDLSNRIISVKILNYRDGFLTGMVGGEKDD